MSLSRDAILGVGMMVLAAAYWAAADQIPVSLLSDGVGADGAPKLYAIALGTAAALLVLTSRRKPAAAAADDARKPGDSSSHGRAALLLLGLVLYIALLPVLGYPLSIALLIAGVAIYGGTKPTAGVVLVAIGGAAVFWIFFVKLLSVDMPSGVWISGF